MATTLNRTAYNLLIDDDGTGNTGTVISKSTFDDVLDTVDGAFANTSGLSIGGPFTANGDITANGVITANGNIILPEGNGMRGTRTASPGTTVRMMSRRECTLINGSFVNLGSISAGVHVLYNGSVGGMAVVMFQNGSTPVIISQTGGFTWGTGSVPSNGIQLADGGGGAMALKCDAGRNGNVIWTTVLCGA